MMRLAECYCEWTIAVGCDVIAKVGLSLASNLRFGDCFWTHYIGVTEIGDGSGPRLIADLTQVCHGLPEETQSFSKMITR